MAPGWTLQRSLSRAREAVAKTSNSLPREGRRKKRQKRGSKFRPRNQRDNAEKKGIDSYYSSQNYLNWYSFSLTAERKKRWRIALLSQIEKHSDPTGKTAAQKVLEGEKRDPPQR